MKKIATALLILSVALGVAWFGWWSAVSPAALNRVPISVVKAINLPVATIGWLTRSYQGIDLWYGSRGCDFCTPFQHTVHYFTFAIPIYAVIFWAVYFVWSRKRRHAV